MQIHLLTIALAGMLASACAVMPLDADTAQSAPAAEGYVVSNRPIRDETGEIDDDAIRCVREISGSRLPGRQICRTEREWALIRQYGRETLEEMQRAPQNSPY